MSLELLLPNVLQKELGMVCRLEHCGKNPLLSCYKVLQHALYVKVHVLHMHPLNLALIALKLSKSQVYTELHMCVYAANQWRNVYVLVVIGALKVHT